MLSLFRWKIRSRLCSASRNKNNHLCGLFKSQASDGTCSVGAVVAISVCPTWCRSCLLKCFTQQGQESFTWCSGHTTSHCRGVTLTEKRHELHMGIITLSLLGVFSQFFLYKWFVSWFFCHMIIYFQMWFLHEQFLFACNLSTEIIFMCDFFLLMKHLFSHMINFFSHVILLHWIHLNGFIYFHVIFHDFSIVFIIHCMYI